MEIAKIIKIFIQRYRVISLKAPSIITPSSIMLHDPIRSEPPLVYLTPLLWRFVLLTERLRLHEVLKLGQPLCEAFKLYSGPRGTGILTKPILKKFKCPDGGRGAPGGTGVLKLRLMDA